MEMLHKEKEQEYKSRDNRKPKNEEAERKESA